MSKQPLEGVKVVDFSWWVAGPMATKCLADLGAQVVKVENRKHIDICRVSEPYQGGTADVDKSGFFLQFNTSKLSLGLDVTHPDGKAVAKKLVAWADVVVENFAPGTMERMGLGYEDLRAVNEDIIMLRSSSFGPKSVNGKKRGAGHVAGSLAGTYLLAGWPDRTPSRSVSIAWVDATTSILSATAILAALDYRRRTGKGQQIDVTQLEVMAHTLAPAFLDFQVNRRTAVRSANRNPDAAPHGLFPCEGDDAWCAIAVFSDEEWRRLCKLMEQDALAKDPRFSTLRERKAHEDELEQWVSSWTIHFTPDELMSKLQQAGVPSGAVQTAADLVDSDPQVRARELFVKLEHPAMGLVNHPSTPFKLSKTPARLQTAPRLGEHNHMVCTEILGMSDEEFTRLLNAGIIV